MRTGVVDGVELTVHVEQGDLLSLHLDQFPRLGSSSLACATLTYSAMLAPGSHFVDENSR
jgi:hypothetical protein